MSDLYAYELEMRLRFAEEDRESDMAKSYYAGVDDGIKKGRLEGIDELANVLANGFTWSFSTYTDEESIKRLILHVAEQLKENK